MPAKPKFTDGEKVLCFHGPLMYEAKTLKTETKDKTVKYLVHYNGWNKSWDEWVPETRVLKYGESSLQKQKELKKSHEAKMKQAKANKSTSKKPTVTESEEKVGSGRPRGKASDRSATPNVKESKSEKKRGPKAKESKQDKDQDKDDEWDKASTKSSEDLGSSTTSRKRGRQSKSKIEEVPAKKDRKSSSQPDKDKDKIPPAVSESESDVTSKAQTESSKSSTTKESAPKPDSKQPQSKKDENDDGQKKKRIRGEPNVDTEESFVTKIEVRIKVPDELKPWLVDDWDMISRQKYLVNIPCKNNVECIIEDYIKSKDNKGPHPQKDAIVEVTQGIKDYFNVMLGSQLLYKFERAQYAEVLADHPDKTMSQIYGAIHLLRLFVRLGGMLAYTPLDEKSTQLLLTHIHDFIKYMSKNAQSLFSLSDYALATPEYHRRAM